MVETSSYPLTCEWINRVWSIHAMERDSVFKRKGREVGRAQW